MVQIKLLKISKNIIRMVKNNYKNKLSFVLFLSLLIYNSNLFAQDSLLNQKIGTAIYLNFIEYSSSLLNRENKLSQFENFINGNLSNINSPPYFQQMLNFPYCIKKIRLKKTQLQGMKLSKEGEIYEYDLSNELECHTVVYDKLNQYCSVENILPDNQLFNNNDKLFPNLIYRQGLVFYEYKTKKIYFISGFLNKSSINDIFDEPIDELELMVKVRYSNYIPKDVKIIKDKRIKRITFYSSYPILSNVLFEVVYSKGFSIEKFSYTIL